MKIVRALTIILMIGIVIVLNTAAWSAERGVDEEGGADKLLAEVSRLFDQRETLHGLHGVFVNVAELSPEAESFCLSQEALQTDTELQLHQYGVKVLSMREATFTPGFPWLNVMVNVANAGDDTGPIVGVVLQVELLQMAALIGQLEDKPTSIALGAPSKPPVSMVTTWSRGKITFAARKDMRAVREVVKDLVTRFINDYFAANPDKARRQNASEETPDVLTSTFSLPKGPPALPLIEAIVQSGDTPYVIIGDEFLTEGDVVKGYRIRAIHADRVEFEKDGRTSVR